MASLILVAVLCLASAGAAPVKFDQRQEGEFNVHASVENVLIVYIPSSSAELMNLISVAASSGYKSKSLQNSISDEESAEKPRPITIDIDIRGPVKQADAASQPDAQSPSASLSKPDEEKKSGPSVDNIELADSPKDEKEQSVPPAEPAAAVVPPPSEAPQAASPAPAEPPKQAEEKPAPPPEKTEEPKSPAKAKSPKFINLSDGKPVELEDKAWNKLRMLSSGLDECSEGQTRNSRGLCETIVTRQSDEQNLVPLLRFGLSPAN